MIPELRAVLDAADDFCASLRELGPIVEEPASQASAYSVVYEGGAFSLLHDGETLSVFPEQARAVRTLRAMRRVA